jgi:hypothetical protein
LALRHWAVNDRRLTENEDVVAFFKRYIDEVADQRLLERSEPDHLPSTLDGYGGLGFSSHDTDEFQQIFQYIRTRSKEIAAAELRARAEIVLDEAEAGDLDAMFKLVRNDEYELSTNPVLKDIPVNRVAELMARDVPALNAGSKMLAYRYHRARNGDPLLQEIPWARGVYAAVVEKLYQWEEPHRAMALKSMTGLIRHYEQGKQPDDMIIPSDATPPEFVYRHNSLVGHALLWGRMHDELQHDFRCGRAWRRNRWRRSLTATLRRGH